MTSKTRTKTKLRTPLPKKFRGAEVVRGKGMHFAKLDALVDRKALGEFDATRDTWLVVEDRALEDLNDSVEVKGFATKADAVRYAQACANGNVDHRVLCVTEQVLVVATDNDL